MRIAVKVFMKRKKKTIEEGYRSSDSINAVINNDFAF